MTTARLGDPAPDFTAETSGGRRVTLSELRGRTVVLYFYTKDNTPGCTREACDFRDAAAALTRKNAVVLGVSTDSVASHDRFAAKHGLEFPLISDPDHTIAEKYGVWRTKSLWGRTFLGMVRSTFVIDEKGRIAEVYDKVRVKDHVDKVLAAL